eukprot:g613.t1
MAILNHIQLYFAIRGKTMKRGILASKRRLRQLLCAPVQFEIMPNPSDLHACLTTPLETFGTHPWQIAISCSPIQGIDKTVEVALELCKHIPANKVIPHVSCRLLKNHTHLEEVVGKLEGAGITSAFFIGGDVEHYLWMRDTVSTLTYMHNKQLGQSLKIGVACYPEGYPGLRENLQWDVLLNKQRYADFMVSQLCFRC